MKGLDNIPFRNGHHGRIANASKAGRIEALFVMGYRPFIQSPYDIDAESGTAKFVTQDLGGGDIGIAMEIPDETDVARNAIKTMITEMGIDGGFGNPEGTGPLRSYINKEVEEKVLSRIETHLMHFVATYGVWSFILLKITKRYDRVLPWAKGLYK